MICKNCSATIDDNCQFCSNCGSKIEDSTNTPQENENDIDNPILSQTDTLAEDIKSDKKNLIIGITAIVIVLFAIIFIVLSLVNKDKKGPFSEICQAAYNTIESKNFTLDITGKYTVYENENNVGSGKNIYNGKVDLSLDADCVNFDIGSSYKFYCDDFDSKYKERFVFYKDTLICFDENEEIEYTEDISDENFYEISFDIYNEYNNGLDNLSKINWKNILNNIDNDYEDYINYHEFVDCTNELFKNLNDEEYLKEICNEYSKEKSGSKTTYSFNIEAEDILKKFLRTMKPSLEQDLYNDIKDEIKYMLDDRCNMKMQIGIDNKRLVSFNIEYREYMYDGYYDDYKLSINISDFNKSALDKSEIEALLN